MYFFSWHRAGARHTDPHRDHHPCHQATGDDGGRSRVHDGGVIFVCRGLKSHHQSQETVCLTLRLRQNSELQGKNW